MSVRPRGALERCGLVIGGLLAPITASVSRVRRARMFHPDGVVFSARIEPTSQAPELRRVAERLGNVALVRFSSAWWRAPRELPDVLGVALRFHEQSEPQDLLLATIRFPWTTPFAPLVTHFRSFLWNHYHAVSPFEVDGIGLVKLRLRSPRFDNPGRMSRVEHLGSVVTAGRAVYELELRRLAANPLTRRWEPLARVALERPRSVDQQRLRFSPFADGAGLSPVGFVHALRVAAYAASQAARPAASDATPAIGSAR